ncbi:4-alpha-glucanotransferase [Treponema sp. OMZ 838]|uniref:4-alpha-glucanotransferase n=1 Tax=Treponema sp. OMZ 838 TaxID=1539298 RepID=UPI0005301054|nr:4-alpha-glucanotransferase [Treponema sp. OMZ 838]AIW89401.1 4-alpha-glucanotransferase [Treponema sp. OMZ 838]
MKCSPLNQALCGTAVPVSALYSQKSCGVGEFSDLIPFADFCKKVGLRIIQLLPVNDTGTDSSPYNALSAFALHPLYICLDDIPEAHSFKAEIKKIRAAFEPHTPVERFRYRDILHEKNVLLHAVFNKAESQIIADSQTGELAEWIQVNPWITEYAVFKNIKRQNYYASWKDWKECAGMRSPSTAKITAAWNDPVLKREHLFYAWVQMHLHKQLLKAVTYCADNGISVKGDIPILMNEDSVEVWAHLEYFRSDLRAGSPPDGDNPTGQNWGFPIYNWVNLKATGYRWWKERLRHASQYYHAYRLDHILGFFRIWAITEGETTGLLGKPIPYAEITIEDLKKAGFSESRIRWMAEPHINTDIVQDAVNGDYLYSHGLLRKVADRIGTEELWLFRAEIQSEADIHRCGLPPKAETALRQKWADRMLVKAGKDLHGAAVYTAAYLYRNSTAWRTLSDDEQRLFSLLLDEKEALQNQLWAAQAGDILSELCGSVDMQPCAEDLGAKPAALPEVLEKLHILSLRVFRWEREWKKNGAPFIPLQDYPKAAVAVTSVHDSSTLREWWEQELSYADMLSFFDALHIGGKMQKALCPIEGEKPAYTADLAVALLSAFVKVPSVFALFPIQDWLGVIIDELPESKACEERINVPGTVSKSNWTYRLPLPIEALSKNKELIKRLRNITSLRHTELTD